MIIKNCPSISDSMIVMHMLMGRRPNESRGNKAEIVKNIAAHERPYFMYWNRYALNVNVVDNKLGAAYLTFSLSNTSSSSESYLFKNCVG